MGRIGAAIKVNGIVQGVGFRPFIHRQVGRFGLTGWIRNSSEGADICIEGEEENVRSFIDELWTKKPKLALIDSVEPVFYTELKGFTDFRIIGSRAESESNTLISPDIGICGDCLLELFDPSDRRYRYPFINCTNCGPRFTIIKDIPYDRPGTTMGSFPMCPECAAEYGDIENRRYHAQPTCCPECGPELFYLDAEGRRVEGDPVRLAQKELRDGKIVAIKGLGGIHLACRFDDPSIPAELRARKRRDEKPFAIMCADAAAAEELCFVSEEERAKLTDTRRPIVLLEKRDRASYRQISENSRIGVMLPYTPLHYLLFDEEAGFRALVMTSANLSDRPIMYRNDEAVAGLSGVADGFLLNNRDIETRCDDSLLWVLDGREYFARRSRGYVPYPVIIKGLGSGRAAAVPRVLALGAEQKASFCITRDNKAFPSQHIGDLKNLETYENYEAQIRHFERLFSVRPELLVCDLHPDYLSTSYAEERAGAEGLPLLRLQHHYAHMTSCMADNGLTEKVIGVVWDGTGYGTDGTVWGGEFLAGDFNGFERLGHIAPIRLPGGDRAVFELDRVGISLLKDAGLDYRRVYGDSPIADVLDADINCPRASSMGRLFDGVASILGIRQTASYEGQGAVLLEAEAFEGVSGIYDIELKDGAVFVYRPMLEGMLKDLDDAVPRGVIAARFMNTMVEMAFRVCRCLREETGIKTVVLSGGSFQNIYMTKRLVKALEAAGLRPYTHKRVSANDEGISLGQAVTAIMRSRVE